MKYKKCKSISNLWAPTPKKDKTIGREREREREREKERKRERGVLLAVKSECGARGVHLGAEMCSTVSAFSAVCPVLTFL